MVEGFYNFAQSVDRKNVAKFFPLCASIFFFVLYSNYFALVPGVGSIGVCRVEHAAEGARAAEPHIRHPAHSPVFQATVTDGKVIPAPARAKLGLERDTGVGAELRCS